MHSIHKPIYRSLFADRLSREFGKAENGAMKFLGRRALSGEKGEPLDGQSDRLVGASSRRTSVEAQFSYFVNPARKQWRILHLTGESDVELDVNAFVCSALHYLEEGGRRKFDKFAVIAIDVT